MNESTTPNTKHEATEKDFGRQELREKILNEGSIPRRTQLLDNLIEEVETQAYKRGFKEAESLSGDTVKVGVNKALDKLDKAGQNALNHTGERDALRAAIEQVRKEINDE
ncbi:hypothetical protein [Gordonia terrae]|uniref:hypothetical protein n=1 Tax=Gordonia terrae TaxID=2055 RepID=UPI0012686A9E|nr:hypothetical protein [Gordonia terrae]